MILFGDKAVCCRTSGPFWNVNEKGSDLHQNQTDLFFLLSFCCTSFMNFRLVALVLCCKKEKWINIERVIFTSAVVRDLGVGEFEWNVFCVEVPAVLKFQSTGNKSSCSDCWQNHFFPPFETVNTKSWYQSEIKLYVNMCLMTTAAGLIGSYFIWFQNHKGKVLFGSISLWCRVAVRISTVRTWPWGHTGL